MALTANRIADNQTRSVQSLALGKNVFLVDCGRDCLVYAPLVSSAFLVPSTIDHLHRQLTGDRLHQRFLLSRDSRSVRSRLDQLGAFDVERPSTPAVGPPQPTKVTLFLTTACNLRCCYCYASTGSAGSKNMPLSIARAAVKTVLGNALAVGVPAVELAFHGGGEPTLAWDTLVSTHEFACSAAKPSGIRINTLIGTNGILSEEKIAWMLKNASGASVSFDGLPGFQDRNRPLPSGAGSSDHVLRTIAALDREQFSYGLRLTVTNQDISGIADSIRFIGQRFRPLSIMVEPAYRLGRWQGADRTEVCEFIESFHSALQAAREYGLTVMYSGARYPAIFDHFCGATLDNFSVMPDGQVSACYMALDSGNPLDSHFIYGRFDYLTNTFHFDPDVLAALRSQSAGQQGPCRDCFARWHCGGDCLYQVLKSWEAGGQMHTDRCRIVKELTRDAILESIARSPGGY